MWEANKTVGKGSACEVPSLGFSEAFSTVLHTCLVLELPDGIQR